MKRDTTDILNDLLQDWHNASKSEPLVAERTECVTFAHHASNRGAMFEHEIAEDSLESTRLAAIQFHVDQLSPEHRTALQFEARNLNARSKSGEACGCRRIRRSATTWSWRPRPS